MPFCLKNAPATFQRLMKHVLDDVPECSVYLDDVMIYSGDWESHMHTLTTVFQSLADASLTVNLAKCEFAKATVTYLGKQVGLGQVRPMDAKVTVVMSLPVHQTRHELRRFCAWQATTDVFAKTFRSWLPPLPACVALKFSLCGARDVKWLSKLQNLFCVMHLYWLPLISLNLFSWRWMQPALVQCCCRTVVVI